MPVNRHNAIGVLRYYFPIGIHAECPHLVIVFIRLIDDLTLIDVVGNMLKNLSGQFHPYSDIHAVFFLFNSHSVTDAGNPL